MYFNIAYKLGMYRLTYGHVLTMLLQCNHNNDQRHYDLKHITT